MKRLFRLAFKTFARAATLETTESTKLKDIRITKVFEPVFSERADVIYNQLYPNNLKLMDERAELDGKKSLAWILWALKAAQDAAYEDGISVHDVSALVYQAAKVELYPINVSRMVHGHGNYIRQVSQERKTKRYLLTDEGLRALASL